MKTRIFREIGFIVVAAAASLTPLTAQEDAQDLSVADRLEEAILLQEGKADHTAAIEVYRDILETGSLVRTIAAEAQFRLAECLLAQGDEHQAEIVLKKLTKEFPEEEYWVNAASEHLPKDLDPQSTPWVDGERHLYEYILPSGNLVGYSSSVINRIDWEGRALWRMEHRRRVGGIAMMSVEFDPETFESVYSGVVSDSLGIVDCWFNEGADSVEAKYSNNEDIKTFSFSEKHYDNEQATELVRQLPTEVGYRTMLNIFVNFTGGTIGVGCEIVELVELDTILGKRECYKIELDLGTMKQYLYVTNDEKRVVVKLEAGGVDINLVRYDTYKEGRLKPFSSERYGYRFDHEDGWVIFEDPENGTSSKEEMKFLVPGGLGGAEMSVNLNSKLKEGQNNGVLELAEFQRSRIEKQKNAIEVGEVSEMTINGLDAAYFEVKSKEKDGSGERAAMFFIKGDERHYRFVLNVPVENWELVLGEFKDMAGSLTEI